jgi:hypothetical protein
MSAEQILNIVSIVSSLVALIISFAAYKFSKREKANTERAKILDLLTTDVADLQASISTLLDWDGKCKKPSFDRTKSNFEVLKHIKEAESFCLFSKYNDLFCWIDFDENGFAFLFSHYIDDFGDIHNSTKTKITKDSDTYKRLSEMRYNLFELTYTLGEKLRKSKAEIGKKQMSLDAIVNNYKEKH